MKNREWESALYNINLSEKWGKNIQIPGYNGARTVNVYSMKHHKLKILVITLVQFYFEVGTGFSLSVRNEEGFGQEVVGHEKQKICI